MDQPINANEVEEVDYTATKKRKAAPDRDKSSKKSRSQKSLVQNNYTQSDYYFHNGLRKVYPYPFDFVAFAKRHWVGRPLLEMVNKEFRHDYDGRHERAIRTGAITVNDQPVSPDYVIKDNDFLKNHVHRHESPVTDEPVKFLHIDQDLVVINKPASIPCHPCGRYRFNSVPFILAKQYGLHDLKIIHRLDRLTSGVLLLGRNTKKTHEIMSLMARKEIKKVYVARVDGKFPDGVIEVKEPLSCISRQLCLYYVHKDGKPAHTTFERISYNGHTSVVRCSPHTGRTHQIRVHLQFLGHPIIDDPLYNSDAWGPNRCKGGQLDKTLAELQDAIREEHFVGNYVHEDLKTVRKSFESQTCYENPLEIRTRIDNTVEACTQEASRRTYSNVDDSSLTNSGSMPDIHQDVGSNTLLNIDKQCSSHDVNTAINKDGGYSGNETVEECEPSKLESLNDLEADSIQSQMDSGQFSVSQIIQQLDKRSSYKPEFDLSRISPDPNCFNCIVRYIDPEPRRLVMFLHALKYQGPGWEFETELPAWAQPDWGLCIPST